MFDLEDFTLTVRAMVRQNDLDRLLAAYGPETMPAAA